MSQQKKGKTKADRQREVNSILMQLMVVLGDNYALVPKAFHELVDDFIQTGVESKGELDFEQYDRTLIYHFRDRKPCVVNLHKKS
jgi:hypothetical protein